MSQQTASSVWGDRRRYQGAGRYLSLISLLNQASRAVRHVNPSGSVSGTRSLRPPHLERFISGWPGEGTGSVAEICPPPPPPPPPRFYVIAPPPQNGEDIPRETWSARYLGHGRRRRQAELENRVDECGAGVCGGRHSRSFKRQRLQTTFTELQDGVHNLTTTTGIDNLRLRILARLV